jgi:DNA-directed RNA polymerase specialized sigma24 family protein
LGIDLKNRAGEVAKLLFAGYGRRIYSWGYDPDDVLQEIYKGILIRNLGTCPWDAKKSSFGHYVHLVCGCLLSNYHRKQSRIRAVEQVGLNAQTEDGFVNVDAADACATRVECASYLDTTPMVDKDFIDYMVQRVDAMGVPTEGRQMALLVLPLAIEGHGRQEIAAALNVPMSVVAKALKIIKTTMSDWSLSPFIG